jgi:hypothetical protein
MDKRIVICPKCDKEQKVPLHKNVVKCSCGGVFNVDVVEEHPSEFWQNPDNSHRF